MSITILTGLPGSGKSETLISRVNDARRVGRSVGTFMCSDSSILRARSELAKRARVCCRSGLTTEVDHFVSTRQCIALVSEAPTGALLAFDEAQHFEAGVVESWCAAAERGVELLIASPSAAQLESLRERGHQPTQLSIECQACARGEATVLICHKDKDRTESVCKTCHDDMRADAEREVIDRLERGPPYPGEQWIYQPVEMKACAKWKVVREDTGRRWTLMRDICLAAGLPEVHSTYLDVGCNTGYFCRQMARLGFQCTGVDVTANDIEVARLLGTYVRPDFANYVLADAHDYLADTRDEAIDVTSAFSVFQWVMIQKTPEHGLDCMRWLFRKTRGICFLEMGESTEAHYAEKVGLPFDRAWVHRFMQEWGGFDRVDVIDASNRGVKRDLFVGYKQACSQAPDLPMIGRHPRGFGRSRLVGGLRSIWCAVGRPGAISRLAWRLAAAARRGLRAAQWRWWRWLGRLGCRRVSGSGPRRR